MKGKKKDHFKVEVKEGKNNHQEEKKCTSSKKMKKIEIKQEMKFEQSDSDDFCYDRSDSSEDDSSEDPELWAKLLKGNADQL